MPGAANNGRAPAQVGTIRVSPDPLGAFRRWGREILTRYRELGGRARHLGAAAVAVGPAAAVLAWHARSYLPFMADDAFMALRYAERLLGGDGLTWSDGPRVEGYSSLLWVLACALLGLVTDLVTASRAVGAGSALLVLAAMAVAGTPSTGAAIAFGIGALALAFSGPFAVWTVGGLEQPMVAAALAWSVVGLWRAAEKPDDRSRLWWPGAALACAVLARPEGPLFAACAALSVLATHGWSILGTWPRLLAAPVGAFAAQLAFRLAYYGEWIPNPARLKLALTPARVAEGLDYLIDARHVLSPLLVAGILSAIVLLLKRDRRRLLPATLLPTLAWTAYVVSVGGDIFPGRRHLVVVLVLLALQTGLSLTVLLQSGRVGRIAATVSGAALIAASAFAGTNDPRCLDARRENWEWIGATTGPFLRQAFAPARPTLALNSAGALGFFARLPAIDMLGLSDFDIPRRLPAGWGRAPLSWDLHNVGNADSVLEREPDVIVPCGPAGSPEPCRSIPWTARLFAHPRFQAEYVAVHFRAAGTPPIAGTVWLRRSSGVVHRWEGDTLALHPALLAHDRGVLRLDGERPYVEIPAGAEIRVGALPRAFAAARVDGDPLVSATVEGSALVVRNLTNRPREVREVILEAGGGLR